jgi:hypothetical protein
MREIAYLRQLTANSYKQNTVNTYKQDKIRRVCFKR